MRNLNWLLNWLKLEGIGIGMNIANAYITFFYNMLMGYALYYIVLSFTSELPWQKCQPEWANTSNLSPKILRNFFESFIN